MKKILITGINPPPALREKLETSFEVCRAEGASSCAIDSIIRICDLENPEKEIEGLRSDIKLVQKSERDTPIALIVLCMIQKPEDNPTAKFVEATLECERASRVCRKPEALPFRFCCINILGKTACCAIADSIASACSHILTRPQRCLITKMSLSNANETLPNEWRHAVAIED